MGLFLLPVCIRLGERIFEFKAKEVKIQMVRERRLRRMFTAMFALLLLIPLFVSAASDGVSGLAVAKYKLEGAQTQGWTNLPINSTKPMNTYNITITKPGMTIVTLYAEDRAGNKNYQIKSFYLDGVVEDAPVDYIEYRLTGATEQDWTRYTGPFVITREGETYLEAKIHDKAGNITTITETIRIDKTSSVNTRAIISLE